MVKALHRAGIEVLLDVVFNHTAEGDHSGTTLCFRGVDNSTYYILDTDRSRYANFSGTGNTLNANHPVVRRMIVDSLRYWVEEMHVDGFRFDLASILARDSSGQVMSNPPVLWDIESDAALAGTKMIAEAWDAAGLYQVGSFVGDSWKEWNGRFRDDVRDFFRGAENTVTRVADRTLGSPEIYGRKQREAEQSVNFVTCHDGFTLNDLVSYNYKHNEQNGEGNRDGADDNRSWNCGVEGPSDDPAVEKLRNRQVKNFLTVTLLSLGVPMIVMGDEVRRTQRGNNNAYCHDDEISWFDWTLLSQHADVHRFVKLLVARRLMRDVEHERRRVSLSQWLRDAQKAWHGVKLEQPDWSHYSHSLALGAELRREGLCFHLILNAYCEPLDFELPVCDGSQGWRRWIDTALESPDDIVEWRKAPPVPGRTYHVGARSVLMLVAGSGLEDNSDMCFLTPSLWMRSSSLVSGRKRVPKVDCQRRSADNGTVMKLNLTRLIRRSNLTVPLQIDDCVNERGCLQSSTVPRACAAAMTSVAASSITTKPVEFQLTDDRHLPCTRRAGDDEPPQVSFFRRLCPESAIRPDGRLSAILQGAPNR